MSKSTPKRRKYPQKKSKGIVKITKKPKKEVGFESHDLNSSEFTTQCNFTKYLHNLNKLRIKEEKNPISFCATTVDEVKSDRGRRKSVSKGYVSGEPDYSISNGRGGYFGLRIEFKSKIGRVEPHQERIHNRLKQSGYLIAICRSVEDAIRTFLAYMLLKPTPIKTTMIDKSRITDEVLKDHLTLIKGLILEDFELSKEDVIEIY